MSRNGLKLTVCLLVSGMLCAAEEAGVWLDVPFVAQEGNYCGEASIAMIMRYWENQNGEQESADAKQIGAMIYSRQARGTYASEMERYLQQHGFRTFAFQGKWSDLKVQLEKGRPIIVALKPGGSNLHYVVVVGLDWHRKLVLKNDPAERKLLKQDRSSFEKQWKAAGNWTLLAVPRQQNMSPPP